MTKLFCCLIFFKEHSLVLLIRDIPLACRIRQICQGDTNRDKSPATPGFLNMFTPTGNNVLNHSTTYYLIFL